MAFNSCPNQVKLPEEIREEVIVNLGGKRDFYTGRRLFY